MTLHEHRFHATTRRGCGHTINSLESIVAIEKTGRIVHRGFLELRIEDVDDIGCTWMAYVQCSCPLIYGTAYQARIC
jgi:hypothetical protein